MVTKICLICVSPCDSPTDNGHFLVGTTTGPKTEDESKQSWSIFKSFCEQMQISLEDTNNCPWDFSKESLPFCSSCKEMVSYISELNHQLQDIQNALSSAVGNLKAKIDYSELALKNSIEAMESEVDDRIPVFRQLLTLKKGRSPATVPVVEDLEQERDVKPVIRTKRSVAQSRIKYQEDSDSEDNNIEEMDEQASESEMNNSDWAPSGEESEEEVKIIGSKESETSFSPRKRKRRNYSENSGGSDSEEEYKPSGGKKTRRSENSSCNEGNGTEGGEGSKPKRSKFRHIRQLSSDTFEYSGHKFIQVTEGYKCAVCPNKPFKTRHGIVGHVKHIHLEERSGYYCQHCGKHCDSPSGLRTHETTHTDIRDCICCECGKGFKNTKNLKRHLKETHKIDLKFLCHKCNQRMKTAEELQAHLSTAHSEDNPIYCENCGRVFPSALKLKDHVDSHKGEKYFRCYYCDTYFLRKDNLKAHFSKEHGVKT